MNKMTTFRVVYKENNEKHACAVDLNFHFEVFAEIRKYHPNARVLFIQEMKHIVDDTYISGPIVFCIDESLRPQYDECIREMTPYEIALMKQQGEKK